MKRILEYIKGLFKNKNLFKDIKFGDIIWGKRYDTLEEKKLIPKGHDQGPFIVIKNMGDKLLCSKGTSVKPHDEYLKYNLYLKDNCYKLTKDTYFKINNLSLIDKNSFIKRYDSLYGEDEENFVKLIKLIHKNNYQGEELNLSINVGDIITYNNKNYLVLDSKDDFICVQLDLKNYSFNNIKKIDYSNIKNISTKENIIYSSTINDDALIYILKKYKENLKNNENKKVVQRGSILRKDNCLYYVYGEESEIWNVFEISETKLYNSIRLKINNNFYYTNFNYEKINKKDNFEILHLCLNEEIDEITKIRKDYQKEKKEQDKNIKTKNLRFNVGDIIESKKFKNNRFIIIKVCNKTYECLSINKIKKAI